jgi:hypothetical protein
VGHEIIKIVGMAWFISSNKTKVAANDFPVVTIKDRLKKVEIKGHSRMTDPGEFYEKLRDKLENSFYSFNKTLLIDIQFEYINTGSSKWLYHVLSHLQDLYMQGGLIEINWYFESDDEVIQEAGEVLQSLIALPINLVTID